MEESSHQVDVEKTIMTFESKGYTVTLWGSVEEATAYLDWEIDGTSVGFGDSQTLERMMLYDRLSSHNEVFDPQHPAEGQDFEQTAKKALAADVFVTSANAIAQTGEIVNIDGSGNRVAGSMFGHGKVYFIVGVNKLTASLSDAIWRARNVAAPPQRATSGTADSLCQGRFALLRLQEPRPHLQCDDGPSQPYRGHGFRARHHCRGARSLRRALPVALLVPST